MTGINLISELLSKQFLSYKNSLYPTTSRSLTNANKDWQHSIKTELSDTRSKMAMSSPLCPPKLRIYYKGQSINSCSLSSESPWNMPSQPLIKKQSDNMKKGQYVMEKVTEKLFVSFSRIQNCGGTTSPYFWTHFFHSTGWRSGFWKQCSKTAFPPAKQLCYSQNCSFPS